MYTIVVETASVTNIDGGKYSFQSFPDSDSTCCAFCSINNPQNADIKSVTATITDDMVVRDNADKMLVVVSNILLPVTNAVAVVVEDIEVDDVMIR